MEIALRTPSRHNFAATVEATRKALAAEGFGILSEIDIQAKMKEKLNREMAEYLILGACAPPLAWDALHAAPEVGVFLPCNVCIRQTSSGVEVLAMDPAAVMPLMANPVLERIGTDVRERLQRVLNAVNA